MSESNTPAPARPWYWIVIPAFTVLLLAALLAYVTARPKVSTEAVKAAPGVYINSVGMEFVSIPAGEFIMGRDPVREQGDASELPAHLVRVAPFYMSRFEVTQGQFMGVMGYNPSRYVGLRRPVDQVTWSEVQEFIVEINRREGGNHYRLPSEAEWEYAARAGTSMPWFFGDDPRALQAYAVYARGNDAGTLSVGSRRPNPWGLYDVYGNVWEWVQDCWHPDYQGAPGDARVPMSGDCSLRVLRGGGWDSPARAVRSAARGSYAPDLNDASNGFRLVRVP